MNADVQYHTKDQLCYDISMGVLWVYYRTDVTSISRDYIGLYQTLKTICNTWVVHTLHKWTVTCLLMENTFIGYFFEAISIHQCIHVTQNQQLY